MKSDSNLISKFNAFFVQDDLPAEKLQEWLKTIEQPSLVELTMTIIVRYHEKLFTNRKLRNALYSASSEQLQLNLFGEPGDDLVKEVETLDEAAVEEAIHPQQRTPSKRIKPRRISISEMPLENTDVYPTDPEYLAHPELFHDFGTEVVREIVVPSKKPFVRQQTIHKFCREDENGETIIVTGKPTVEKLFPGSYLSPELAANIITSKVVLGLPLNRQQMLFKQNGFTVSRQDLTNWSVNTSEQYLEVMYNQIHKDLEKQDAIHIDETPLRVLTKKSGSGTKLGSITVGRTTEWNPLKIAFYQYTDTKDKSSLTEMLPQKYDGTIICDAAPAHEVFSNATLQDCMAHARREFDQA